MWNVVLLCLDGLAFTKESLTLWTGLGIINHLDEWLSALAWNVTKHTSWVEIWCRRTHIETLMAPWLSASKGDTLNDIGSFKLLPAFLNNIMESYLIFWKKKRMAIMQPRENKGCSITSWVSLIISELEHGVLPQRPRGLIKEGVIGAPFTL